MREWTNSRYHGPSDDLDQPVDIQAAGDFTRVLLKLTEAVAHQAERPAWHRDSFFRRFARGSGRE